MILAAALAAYTFAVSIVYAVLYSYRPALANALLVLFVALLIIPTAMHDIARWRKRRR